MDWSLQSLEKHLLVGSTLVEGSTLSESEAARVMAGQTVSGHPVHEIRELLNYRSAVVSLMVSLASSPFLSVDLILAFHQRLFVGLNVPAGSFKAHRNFTLRTDGVRHAYLGVAETPEAVRVWVEAFNAPPSAPSAESAAKLYGAFQAIHPFEDGNGRIGRILVAYWLHWRFQKALGFYAKDKLEHLQAIEAIDTGDYGPLAEFFRTRLHDEGA